MINKGYIAGICTGANLEEDIFRKNSHYQSVDNWRDLSFYDDSELLQKLNRYGCCIPEDEGLE